MATTLQLVDNIPTGRFVEIDGKRCEVEKASFTSAISQKESLQSLVAVMSQELVDQKLIQKDQVGAWFWVKTGEYLVPETEYQD